MALKLLLGLLLWPWVACRGHVLEALTVQPEALPIAARGAPRHPLCGPEAPAAAPKRVPWHSLRPLSRSQCVHRDHDPLRGPPGSWLGAPGCLWLEKAGGPRRHPRTAATHRCPFLFSPPRCSRAGARG